jgi:tol-pal system protein YbgF
MLLFAGVASAASTSDRLDVLERRVAQVSELTLQLDQVRSENRELRGQIEQLMHEIENLKRKQRDIYLDIDQRLSTLSGGAPAAAFVPPATDAAAGGSTPAPVVDAAAPAGSVDRSAVIAEYDAAYALLGPRQKRYGEAAKAFEAFLAKYPDDPLAANAQYWLAEAHYVSQDNAAAMKAFEAVVEKFPTSQKAPGALFKIGRLQRAAGNTDAARASFEKVLSDYPNSAAAGLARERLGKLGR